MIELYEGRLGGGKTYSAVVRMVDHIRRGGIVCTNVHIIWPAIAAFIEKRYGLIAESSQVIELDDEHIGLFHRYTPTGAKELPVLVVIDEAHLTFNARDFAKTDKLYRETLTFLTQSRKVNTDVIFIAQSVLNMDKQFMRLVQFIWRFRDLARWKIPGLGITWPLKQILAVQFDYDGRTILQRWFIRKDPAVFALYHTDHIVKPFPRLEMDTAKRTLAKATRKKSEMVKYAIPVIILIGLIAGYSLYKKFTAYPVPSAQIQRTSSPPATVQTQPQRETSKEQGLYDIYREAFVAWNAPAMSLQTKEGGWYQLGEMSSHGFTVAVSDRRAKVFQPNGRDGWIVATVGSPVIAGNLAVNPSPTPSAGKITVAGDDPRKGPEVILSPSPEPYLTPTKFPITKQR